MNPNLRTLAVGLLLAVLIVGAGCAGVLSDDDSARELKLVNQDQTDHAVVVEIARNGNLIYSDGRTVAAESQQNLGPFNQTGEFTVTVTVDGNSTTTTHTFEPDADSVTITNIGIDNQGQVTVE